MAPACSQAPKSRLVVKAGAKPKLQWKWINGTADLASFGEPGTDTDYALCAYLDGVRIVDLSIPAGGTCDGKPCWKETGSVGYRYKSRDGNADGVTKVKVRAGSGKAKMQVKAGRDNLTLPALPLDFGTELVVQLVRSGDPTCWQSTFPSFQRNDAGLFKAKSP